MSIMARFAVLLKPHYKHGIGISLYLLLSSMITVATPFVYKELVDNGILKGDTSWLALMLAGILVSLLVQELLYLGQKSLTLKVRKNVFLKLRMDLYTHLMKLPQSFYSQNHKGRLLSRITSDVDAVQNLLLEKYIYFAHSLLVGLFVFIVISVINWKMVLAAAVFLPLLYILYAVFKNRISLLSNRVQEKQESLMERLHEDLSMVKAIQSYSVLDERMDATYGKMGETEDARKRLGMLYTKASSATVIINLVGLVVIWGMGGLEVTKGRMSIGTLIAISFYLNYIVNLFFNAYYTVMGFQTSLPAARRIFEILDFSPVISNRADAVDRQVLDGSLEFKEVAFGYASDRSPVLAGVSFKLDKGDFVGVVGESGQGKTTLANLIMRFYDPVSGTVEIGGTDIRELTLQSLRKGVAIVTQEDYLFHLSIRDNIVMGRKDVTEQQFAQACELANVHVFVESFEDGYDTNIGENGMKLSAGQKKRVSIARALLDNPYILIFDESTAVLDERTEKDVLESIGRLAENRIVLLITHKTSNLQAVSRILHVRGSAVELCGNVEEYRGKTAQT